MMQTAWILLKNGLFLEAKSFGAPGTAVGELLFNTSMSGYQEIISDPSYAGQFITFTMPEIGNVGCNADDMESSRVHCKGMIVRSYQSRPSNYRNEMALDALLKRSGVLGLCDIDTRFLTKVLRQEGAMMMIASTEISDKEELAKILNASPAINDINYIAEVGTQEIYRHAKGVYDVSRSVYCDAPPAEAKIAAIDFGVKRNILNELTQAGLEVTVVPHTIGAAWLIQEYKEGRIDGVFLSNGPGDPLFLKEIQLMLKELMTAKVPMFGICLGHQLLSIAHGYDTYKLKFGHHGGNHPVQHKESGSVEITAQNHNYNVPESIREIAEVTHVNLFDGTIEGIRYKHTPVMSVQHHPESSPGPHESRHIFKEFARFLKGV